MEGCFYGWYIIIVYKFLIRYSYSIINLKDKYSYVE